MMQLLLHQAVFSVVLSRVYKHPHCLCIWIAWGNWTMYFSCLESNTSLSSWQEFGLIPPNSWERWANIRRSLNSIFAKDGPRLWFLRDFWETFKALHVSHWDPKPQLFFGKPWSYAWLSDRCVLSILSSYSEIRHEIWECLVTSPQ